MNVAIGRVISVDGALGKAEFTPNIKVGDLIYYITSESKQVFCQVTSLSSSPYKGTYGHFKILDVAGDIPKLYTELYIFQKTYEGFIDVGETSGGKTVKLMVNPFFHHVLIAGTTGRGKTHLQILIQEEFLKYRIPSLVIDSQGEFVHLNEISPNAIVVEELRVEDLIKYLQQRRVVIYNLQGLSYIVKAKRTYEILSELLTIKEQDYKQAESDPRLLTIPPVIIDVDEAEIYAPELYTSVLDPQCKEVLVEIAKRGSKYGIGLMVASQRPPQLNVDVRSQCNSAIMFHINDIGSRKVMGILPYVTHLELNRVKNLLRGQCLITGELVEHPVLIYVRDIKTRRAKKTDFEEMLGLELRLSKPEIEKTAKENIIIKDGEAVHKGTGEVEEQEMVPPPPALEEGQLHVPKARTRHYGAPGPLGTSDKESIKLMRQLRRHRK